MEIEQEQNISKNILKEIHTILGINSEYIKDLSTIDNILSSITFPQKEYNDIKEQISTKIVTITKNTDIETTNKKQEEFFKSIQLNINTIYYHTAEKDELTPTMSAFYFCEKSNQIISDKEAAARKLIHLDTTYEHFLDTKNNDFDDISVSSNNQHSYNDKIGKKRKMSDVISLTKSGKKRKIEKNGKIKNEDNNTDSHKYCITSCLFGRKSGNCLMIECEKCNEWFHPKCVGLEEKLAELKEMIFYCPNCSMYRQSEEQDININNCNNNTINNDIKN